MCPCRQREFHGETFQIAYQPADNRGPQPHTARMKTEQGNSPVSIFCRFVQPISATPEPARVLILLPEAEEDDAGKFWSRGIAREWAEELADEREDIYTLVCILPPQRHNLRVEDSRPFHVASGIEMQAVRAQNFGLRFAFGVEQAGV